MLNLILMSTALAGTLVVDAKVPAELSIGGLPVARLYHPSVLRLEVEAGPTQLTVITTGNPQTHPIEISETGEHWVLIGRTGVTTEMHARPEEPAPSGEIGSVEFRAIGDEDVVIRVGDSRHRVAPGLPLTLALPVGQHVMQVRNAQGTVIWAQGSLDLIGGSMVVQLGEGRMPETAGTGGSWRPDKR